MLSAAVILLAACATGPKVNWESRVGSYTYDQAVIELGPPDKSAKLTDGTQVSEWLTSRGRQTGYVTHGGWRSGWFQVNDHIAPDYFLRLTFDSNGTLQAAKKYAK